MSSGPLRGLPDSPAKGTTARARTPYSSGFLLGAAHNHLGRHTSRAGGGVGQLVARQGERPPLLSAIPVRKRAALDTEDEELACLIHAVCAEVGDTPLGDGPALICGLGYAIVGGDLRQVPAEKDERVAAVTPKHERANGTGAERLKLHVAGLDDR